MRRNYEYNKLFKLPITSHNATIIFKDILSNIVASAN